MSALRIAHPAGGFIMPMQGEPEQFRHVIRHFYAIRERWEQVGGSHAQMLRLDATKAGCRPAELAVEQPSFYSAPKGCREHVLADYRKHYEPAYWAALISAIEKGLWGRDQAEPECDLFVGENAVVVKTRHKKGVVDGAPRFVVVSARRHAPRGMRLHDATLTDFLQQALQDLARQTSYKQERVGWPIEPEKKPKP